MMSEEQLVIGLLVLAIFAISLTTTAFMGVKGTKLISMGLIGAMCFLFALSIIETRNK